MTSKRTLTRRGFLAAAGSSAVVASMGMAQAKPATDAAVRATATRPRPTPSQVAWQREELAMFVHFTVNTFTGKEWGEGSESPGIFNPRKLDARQWARTARRAGFGSMILTAKHHDGFCLWPTRTTEHCVRNSPWRDGKGDVVREFVDACRAERLGVGFYLSPWDRNAASYGQGEIYNDFYMAQLEELLGNYGELVEVWFDGANGEGPNRKRQAYDWPRIHAAVRRLQPNAVIFSDSGPGVRWIGNERGEAGTTCWSMVDPRRVPYAGFDASWVPEALMQGDPHGSEWRPGEADVSIRPGWFWHADEDEKVRSATNLMELYFKSVGRNSKLLLNVPPTAEGLFHEHDVRALEQFAQARRTLFAHNLLEGSRVRASGGAAPDAVLDSARGCYWQAPAGASAGWIEFESDTPLTFDVLRLEEAIELGQHIANHRLDIWEDGGWRTVHWGTTIGNARLARFAPCTASRIRVLVEHAYDTPRISRVALFRSPHMP